MELVNLEGRSALVALNESELLILNSALNEICNGIDVQEFDTRIGSSKETVAELLGKIGNVLDQIESSN
ncbi:MULTISPECIES: hypothetical protein [Lelliottia]|uniref:Uncharacterized protein n=1 Tax=Lelliottia wanjuensis TaxID=3050585 RepID=A0AAP4FTN8_9ENTR|nr:MULTISPECIES: hypothetical protein [unclassified Lelliottia]MDK9357374.1 hypothetical protein [Lelliottia sp. V106_16]MDK9362255.1 hypothetical protein [Lelliottia sp. V106_12]MDK9373134.1 hypothetical protein [Lelliottia sp. V106_10]MDK9586554.1 hypothetical protein [Lelliottia sp. V86_10]MDK9599938.1 hypothetical protein [Lelliottia sp. V106_5]